MAAHSLSLRTAAEYIGILLIMYLYFGGSRDETTNHQHDYDDDSEDSISQENLESCVYPDANLTCPEHNLDIHVFSQSPLVMYISNFISEQEANHLIAQSEENWTPSTVHHGPNKSFDPSIRRSEKALMPRDTTVQCLEARALSLQGWPPHTTIERLSTQRYMTHGHYTHHYDWATESRTARRSSSFMVYLYANCTGGGTNFPLLKRPRDERWCEFIDCSGSYDEVEVDGVKVDGGVTFLPKAGAAVFWENFDRHGRGWREGLHAGMPVTSGVKIGLNIWSWYQRGHRPAAKREKNDEL